MKKALSLLLVLAMVLSMVPAVFAEEAANNEMILDNLTVAAGETKNVTFTAEESCKLDLVMTGDGTLTINELPVIEVVVETIIPDNNEGAPDIWEENLTGEGTYEVSAGLEYTVVLVGGEYGATISVEGITYPGSSADYAIWLYEQENTVANAGTVWYQGYFSGMIMTVTGANSVTYNGETLAAVDGVITTAVASANPRMPVQFAVTGEGNIQINFTYPVGTMDNPAALVIGENTASIAAGSQGYWYTWTATEDGTLSITMPSDMGWSYVINNMTTYAYGDTQWSDSDPVVNPATVEVAANDVIQIMVNTYDPADMWNNPAADLTFTAAFEPAVTGPIPAADLVFNRYALSFQEYIGLQFIMMNNITANYDRVYAVVTMGDESVELDYTVVGPFAMFNKDVLSWSMAEDVTATLYATKGDETYIGATYTTSVMDQAIIKLGENAGKNDANCRLFVDMLNYGAAVQIEFNHNADVLPNATLAELGYDIYATVENPEITAVKSSTGTGSVTVSQESLSLQARVELQLIFRLNAATMAQYDAHVTVGGNTTIVDGATFTRPTPTAPLSILSTVFAPYNLRESCTVVICDKEGNAVSPTYTYSVESLVNDKLNGSASDNVFYAMMKYGDSVKNIM